MLDTKLYNDEILSFLQTCSIKYEPFIKILNEKHNYNNDDNLNCPYYLNLKGQYFNGQLLIHFNNGDIIDRNNIQNNPSRLIFYQKNIDEVYNLYKSYPEHVDLIRTSIWPVNKSLEEIHEADNLTLLSYDDSYLDSNERTSLVKCLKETLQVLNERWMNIHYTGENTFYQVWWSNMWLILYKRLHTQRLLNINTESAHNSLILEYLVSNGYKYTSLLNNLFISKFLYKNTHYLNKYRGSNHLLDTLNTHLLQKLGFNLSKFRVYKDTNILNNNQQWTPIVRRTDFDNNINSKKSYTLDQFRYFVKENNLISAPSNTEYDKYIDSIYTNNRYNEIDTKYLSLLDNNYNDSYSKIFIGIVFDLIVFLSNTNKFNVTWDLDDEILDTDFQGSVAPLNAIDIVNLFHYCMIKGRGQEATMLPKQYNSVITIQSKKDFLKSYKPYFYTDNKKFFINSYIDDTAIIEKFYSNFSNLEVTNKDSLIAMIKDIFVVMIDVNNATMITGSYKTNMAYKTLMNQLLIKQIVDLNQYDNITTYEEYFNYRLDLKDILLNYSEPDEYQKLGMNIINNLLVIEEGSKIFKPKFNKNQINDLYNILKRFVSYTIEFLISYPDTITDIRNTLVLEDFYIKLKFSNYIDAVSDKDMYSNTIIRNCNELCTDDQFEKENNITVRRYIELEDSVDIDIDRVVTNTTVYIDEKELTSIVYTF